MTFELVLSMPPSANNLFPTGMNGRRFKSAEYKAWEKTATCELWSQVTPRDAIKGRVGVRYGFAFPNKRRTDIANREKGISDLLVNAGLIVDDCYIDDMQLIRLDIGNGVSVRVWEIARA